MTPIPAPEYLRSHPIFQPYWKHEEQARKEFEDFWTGWCIKNEQWKLKAEFELQVRGATLEFVLRGRGCRNDDRKYCDNIMEALT